MTQTRDYRTEAYRAWNRERMRIYRAGAGKERIDRRKRAYIEAHPERIRVWRSVNRAVKAGRLIRPDRCECGRDSRVMGHHDDYSRPFEVIWLCDLCHKRRHEWLDRKAS